MLRLLGEVLVDVLPARDRRDRGRGDGRVSPGALVRCAERGVCPPPRTLALGSASLAAPPPGPEAPKGGSKTVPQDEDSAVLR